MGRRRTSNNKSTNYGEGEPVGVVVPAQIVLIIDKCFEREREILDKPSPPNPAPVTEKEILKYYLCVDHVIQHHVDIR